MPIQRSTAVSRFNTQVLVDTPLNTEFFRHLPGLLTGIGIIGTFWIDPRTVRVRADR